MDYSLSIHGVLMECVVVGMAAGFVAAIVTAAIGAVLRRRK